MPNTKYSHITNDEVERMAQQGMKTRAIADHYGVKVYTIQRRMETIASQKQTGKWYEERQQARPIPKPKLTGQYTPIWELPKQNGEVKIYRMDMAKITERYGRPGELRQPLPANLWSREGVV